MAPTSSGSGSDNGRQKTPELGAGYAQDGCLSQRSRAASQSEVQRSAGEQFAAAYR